MPVQKDALWQRLIVKNPHWTAGGADFTAAGLRQFFDTVFEQGHALGLENGKALAKMERNPNGGFSDKLKDLLGI